MSIAGGIRTGPPRAIGAMRLAVALGLAVVAGGQTPGSAAPGSTAPSIAPSVGPGATYSATTHSLVIPDSLGLARPAGVSGPLGPTSAFFGAGDQELVVQYFGDAGGDAALARLVAQAKDPSTGATLQEERSLSVPAGQAQRMVFSLGGKRVVIYAIAAATTSAIIAATGIADDAAVVAVVDSFRFGPRP